VVLPRLLAAEGLLADDASISVVPLGGRHVNHFWRLLHGLGIPHVTLLDLDLARYQGGWGRISYAAKQLLAYSDVAKVNLNAAQVNSIPKWDDEQGLIVEDDGWFDRLEKHGVFCSSPLDLDLLMMIAYPEAYGLEEAELEEADEDTLKAVLGKSHDVVENQYTNANSSTSMPTTRDSNSAASRHGTFKQCRISRIRNYWMGCLRCSSACSIVFAMG
jgi:putative ATP-dependent endonuclease of the OLD family